MKKLLPSITATFLLMASFMAVPMVHAAESNATDLLASITNSLGVTEKQGMGGLGSLFGYLKDNVSRSDFSKLASAVPGMDQYLSAVPEVKEEGARSGFGGLLDRAGDYNATAKGLGDMQKKFEALGMTPERISQFADVAMGYFNGTGNTDVVEILKKGLGSFL